MLARGLGEILLTIGVVLLLFAGYEVYGTGIINAHRQSELTAQLNASWTNGEDPVAQAPDIGEGIALIRIPRLGKDYVKVIVEGTSREALADGPGHYTASALPGDVGNFAVAGHNGGNGSPFEGLHRLEAGDPIIIETRDTYYVYRVLGDPSAGGASAPDSEGLVGKQVVQASEVGVVLPVPNHPGETPHRRLLTLTTCKESFFTIERLIIHAELAGQPRSKADGIPPEQMG